MRDTNLVNALREHAEWARANEWETPITLGDDLTEAADRLENQNAHILALQKEIAGLRGQLPRWIPVEERLPDAPGHYLICTNINYWHGGCLDKNEERKYFNHCGTTMGYEGTTKSVLDCYYDVTGSWNRVWDSHVTHWMPLSEPPEEERRTKQ